MDASGWFWKTMEDWEKETGMKRREQETARKCLVGLKILEEKLTGIPAKLYFRVDVNRLGALLESLNQSNVGGSQVCTNPPNKEEQPAQTSMAESAKLRVESTSETTSEITTLSPLPPERVPEPPIELPRGFPKSIKEALLCCLGAGVPDKFIENDWLDCHGRGGKDRHGQLIHHFPSHIKSAYDRRKSYEAEQKLRQPDRQFIPAVKPMDQCTVYDCL